MIRIESDGTREGTRVFLNDVEISKEAEKIEVAMVDGDERMRVVLQFAVGDLQTAAAESESSKSHRPISEAQRPRNRAPGAI